MRSLIALALFLLAQPVTAQSDKANITSGIARNTIYAEGMGNGQTYSINYDRLFLRKEKFALAGRVGIGVTPNRYKELFYQLPVEICPLVGKGKHFFETGAGFTFIQMVKNEDLYVTRHPWVAGVLLRTGYRFQKPDGGIFFRAGFLVIFPAAYSEGTYFTKHVIPWGGVSLGYTFKKKK